MKQNWLAATTLHEGVLESFVSADLRQVDPVDVNFNNCLQLAGVRMARDGSGITLTLYWRALRRPTRPWRCFVHVVSQGRQFSSLDHEILRGRPPVTRWEAEDEGYESLRLWLDSPPEGVNLRLGLYDPEINVRAVVLRSNLPVADESSAVWIDSRDTASPSYAVDLERVPLSPCSIVFEDGIEMAAYSAARHNDLVWLRLKWIVRRGGRRGVRFFGHVIPELSSQTPALAQFDQDLAMENTGPVTAIEQNVIRAVPRVEPAWLRAGLCDSDLKRLRLLSGTAELDPDQRCAYLALSPSPPGGSPPVR